MEATGIVLAAGASRRLGQPKQLLSYRGRPLLDSTLDMARKCGFRQIIVALGGAADRIREQVDLTGVQTVQCDSFADGCGSSIRTAITEVDPEVRGVVLLPGDQPGVDPATVRALVSRGREASIGICRYRNGWGHPFWFGRDLFAHLATLHGNKAVWKLLHSGRFPVTEHDVSADVPLDVDTWADYQTLIEQPR